MLPNLVVIGAMKSGTTSLHNYLDLHPQIAMSSVKESNFFIVEKNWSRGVQWYESNFAGQTKILGESSTNYTMCHIYNGVPKRMHSILPEAKLIYILRDPIDRIVSHYTHDYHQGREKRSISETLTDLENNHYVFCSKYYMQLEQYLNYFPQSNILIITLEDLSRHRHCVLRKVFGFLEVDDSFYSQAFTRVLHKSSDKRRKSPIGVLLSRTPGKNLVKSFLPSHFAKAYYLLSHNKVKRPTLSERSKQELIDHLQDDVNSLRKYTGSGFEHWCL